MRIAGNYTNQQYRNFPLDAEGLLAIQDNVVACELIGRLAGDKAIIAGCENDGKNARNPGWLWLKTPQHPYGELLWWKGGATEMGLRIASNAIEVQADGYVYPQAYTERMLVPGGDENEYKWEDFHDAESTADLRKVIDAQALAIAMIKPEPVGVVKMYAGVAAPEKYKICDGAMLAIAEYGELYATIGAGYNNAPAWNGVVSAPPVGMFKIPDLRGRFVVGQNPLEEDYKTIGAAGGEKMVRLAEKQIPSHNHVTDERFTKLGAKDTDVAGGRSVSQTDDNRSGLEYVVSNMTEQLWNASKIKSVGGDESHENRPPWYALSYIIKVK